MDPLYVTLGVGVLAYILFVLLVPKAVPDESDAYLKQALDRLAEENRAAEQSRRDVLRDQLSDTSPVVRTIFQLGFMRPLHEAALAAGYQNNLQKPLIIGAIAFVVVMLAFLRIGSLPGALIFSPVLAYLIPLRHCRKVVRKRNSKFVDLFPDALDIIVRSVKSGFPLSVALQILAENAEEPVRTEFRLVNDEIALGRTLHQTLSRLATRINEPDVRFFVVVLNVQQETGGNLAEIIGNLSSIIRKRKQIRHKIKAMTSEGKATGIVLGGLPVFVFGALWFIQPGYLDPFFYDPLGQMIFGGAIALLGICYVVVKQMINVDI